MPPWKASENDTTSPHDVTRKMEEVLAAVDDDGSDTSSESGSEDPHGRGYEPRGGPLHNQKLEKCFKEKIKYLPPSRSPQKAAVLMLYWEGKGEMDVKEEVDKLRAVFEQQYHYTVYDGPLSWESGKKALNRLNRHIAEFIDNEDGKYNLLIVYYAGHGVANASSGDLDLVGGNKPAGYDDQATRVMWSEAEHLLHNAEADKLIIFDCCFAGILANPPRADFSSTIYEYIGSTTHDKTAVGPGPDSFTTALTWALSELAKEPRGFTINKLLKTVRNHHAFKTVNGRQTPVTAERGKKPCIYKLKIRRPHITRTKGQAARKREPLPYEIHLQYVFKKIPTEDHITRFCEGLNRVIMDEQLPIKGVIWNGHRDHDAIARDTLKKWRHYTRDSIMQRPKDLPRLNGAVVNATAAVIADSISESVEVAATTSEITTTEETVLCHDPDRAVLENSPPASTEVQVHAGFKRLRNDNDDDDAGDEATSSQRPTKRVGRGGACQLAKIFIA